MKARRYQHPRARGIPARTGWLHARGTGTERRYALTRKGRGRARALQHAGAAPDDEEARVREPDQLLDLIYADCTAGSTLVDVRGLTSSSRPLGWFRDVPSA
jgi:hypothetical protein